MELVYHNSPSLVVEPHHYSGGVPVFMPTMEQFEDFYAFNKAINKYGMELGIVKVIPPAEWKSSLPKYSQKALEKIKIKNPIIQHINGSGAGVYSLQNIERLRTYSIAQWKELLNQSNFQPPAPRGKVRDADKVPSDKTSPEAMQVHLPPQSPERNHRKLHRAAVPPPLPVPERQLRKRSDSVTGTDSHLQKQHAKAAKHQKQLQNNFKNYNIDTSIFTEERCEQLESNYWKTLTYAEPMYGADSLGSLFPPNFKTWNVAHLPNILDLLDAKLPGVNDAYLYAGLWKATFSWHLEDQDLYSINYLHFGAPKQWYSIPQAQANKFYNLMKDSFPEDSRSCLEFLRHKTYMMSPQCLAKHGISVNKIIHREGEFMITYPYGYHSGFNYGYNLAESVNFAIDDWFPFGESSKKCECINDSVGINVKMLYCKFKGIDYELEEKKRKEAEAKAKEEEERILHEKNSTANEKITKFRKKKSPVGKVKVEDDVQVETRGRPKKVLSPIVADPPKKVIERIEINYQCLLCPNNLAKSLTKLKPFLLLDTEFPDKKVHSICAQQFKELKGIETGTVRGFSEITKAQNDLRCLACQPSLSKKKQSQAVGYPPHGACFQCEHPKCVRSYHATCAVGSGFSFSDGGNNRCKFHRGKVVYHKCNQIKTDRIAKVMRNSIIQFTTLNRETFSGLVVANMPEESVLHVTAFPQMKERLEVSYDNVLMSDDVKVDTTQNTILFYKRKKKVKEDVGANVNDNKIAKRSLSVPIFVDVLKHDIVDMARSEVVQEFSTMNLPTPRILVNGNFITATVSPQLYGNEGARPNEWWYYVPKQSTDTIGRYTNNYKSRTPNDPNYLKSVERKKKRTMDDSHQGSKKTKSIKFTQVEFKPTEENNSITLPTMASGVTPLVPSSGNLSNFTMGTPFFNPTNVNNTNNRMDNFIPSNIGHEYNQNLGHNENHMNIAPMIMHGRVNPYVNLTANR